jgi:hypothetical protein
MTNHCANGDFLGAAVVIANRLNNLQEATVSVLQVINHANLNLHGKSFLLIFDNQTIMPVQSNVRLGSKDILPTVLSGLKKLPILQHEMQQFSVARVDGDAVVAQRDVLKNVSRRRDVVVVEFHDFEL